MTLNTQLHMSIEHKLHRVHHQHYHHVHYHHVHHLLHHHEHYAHHELALHQHEQHLDILKGIHKQQLQAARTNFIPLRLKNKLHQQQQQQQQQQQRQKPSDMEPAVERRRISHHDHELPVEQSACRDDHQLQTATTAQIVDINMNNQNKPDQLVETPDIQPRDAPQSVQQQQQPQHLQPLEQQPVPTNIELTPTPTSAKRLRKISSTKSTGSHHHHHQQPQHQLAAAKSKQRSQIQFFMLAAMAYILSPIDLVPEAIFGVFGIIDDILFLFTCLSCIAIILIYPLFVEVRHALFDKLGLKRKPGITNKKF